jgi:hypothetical protein
LRPLHSAYYFTSLLICAHQPKVLDSISYYTFVTNNIHVNRLTDGSWEIQGSIMERETYTDTEVNPSMGSIYIMSVYSNKHPTSS